MEIYKINNICINQLNTQFSLSYNKGIKIYDIKTFKLVSCSNKNSTNLVNKHKINFNREKSSLRLCFMS